MSKDSVREKLENAKRRGINTGNPTALMALMSGRIDDALTASIPGGIEASEALGQQEVVHGWQLPKERLLVHREKLEAMGFVFGEEIDDVFVSVKLPAGWSKNATDHNMWSDLLDNRGRRRAGIFFKAAFYDRNGHMDWKTRFSVDVRLEGGHSIYDLRKVCQKRCYATVLDVDTKVYRTELSAEPLSVEVYCDANEKLQEPLIAQARAWLNERYPNWHDSFAHWDD